MKCLLALLLGVVTVAAANPILASFFSEIQVAPDSLERIEVNPRVFGLPYDLSGCTLVTNAGRAVIASGTIIYSDTQYLVLDRHNLTGPFHLGDSSDAIWLRGAHGGDVWDLLYPSYYGGATSCVTPPAGMSSALVWTSDSTLAWYTDPTPTLGAPNDDSAGGIYGRVFDQDSHPLNRAYVSLAGRFGGTSLPTEWDGSYSFHPTGLGTFLVSARWAGFTGAYPESVHVEPNETRAGIDIYITTSAVPERPRASPARINWRKGGLNVTVSQPARADLRLFDALGRRRWVCHTRLERGANHLWSMPAMPGGIYIIQGTIGSEPVNCKLTVLR